MPRGAHDREIVKLHFDCVLLSFRWDKRGKELIAAQILNTAGNAALVDQDFNVSRTCLWCINVKRDWLVDTGKRWHVFDNDLACIISLTGEGATLHRLVTVRHHDLVIPWLKGGIFHLIFPFPNGLYLLQNIFSRWGYKSEIVSLPKTLAVIWLYRWLFKGRVKIIF